jgi:hypothetical protein
MKDGRGTVEEEGEQGKGEGGGIRFGERACARELRSCWLLDCSCWDDVEYLPMEFLDEIGGKEEGR